MGFDLYSMREDLCLNDLLVLEVCGFDPYSMREDLCLLNDLSSTQGMGFRSLFNKRRSLPPQRSSSTQGMGFDPYSMREDLCLINNLLVLNDLVLKVWDLIPI